MIWVLVSIHSSIQSRSVEALQGCTSPNYPTAGSAESRGVWHVVEDGLGYSMGIFVGFLILSYSRLDVDNTFLEGRKQEAFWKVQIFELLEALPGLGSSRNAWRDQTWWDTSSSKHGQVIRTCLIRETAKDPPCKIWKWTCCRCHVSVKKPWARQGWPCGSSNSTISSDFRGWTYLGIIFH